MERRKFIQGLAAALGVGTVAAAAGITTLEKMEITENATAVAAAAPAAPIRAQLIGTTFGPLTEEQAIKCLVEMAGKQQYPRIRMIHDGVRGGGLKISSEHVWYIEAIPGGRR